MKKKQDNFPHACRPTHVSPHTHVHIHIPASVGRGRCPCGVGRATGLAPPAPAAVACRTGTGLLDVLGPALLLDGVTGAETTGTSVLSVVAATVDTVTEGTGVTETGALGAGLLPERCRGTSTLTVCGRSYQTKTKKQTR